MKVALMLQNTHILYTKNVKTQLARSLLIRIIKSGPFIVMLRSRSGSGPVKVQSMSDLKRYLNISEDLKR